LLVKAKNWLTFMRIPIPNTIGVSNFGDPVPFPWTEVQIRILIPRCSGSELENTSNVSKWPKLTLTQNLPKTNIGKKMSIQHCFYGSGSHHVLWCRITPCLMVPDHTMSYGADPDCVKVRIRIQILVRGSGPGPRLQTSKQERASVSAWISIYFFLSQPISSLEP
jgi:hypothetical protein